MLDASQFIPPFSCPVCDNSFTGQVVAEEILPDGDVVIIQECPTCHLHITYPRLEDPQGAYSDLDETSWNKKYGAIDRGEQLHDRHQNYLEELSIIQHYVPNGRILDVGCHSGWLLGMLQASGYEHLEGVEPSPFLASVTRRRLGIPVHEMFLQDLADSDSLYDAIIATDVIEHINPEDQDSFLGAMRALLKPDGYVFIKTPNVRFTKLKATISNQLPEILKRQILMHRDLWDAKEHVVLWDEETLKRMFERIGFKVVRVFVPLPVQTRNSPLLARLARHSLYTMSQVLGGKKRIPPIAQDMFLVAQKQG